MDTIRLILLMALGFLVPISGSWVFQIQTTSAWGAEVGVIVNRTGELDIEPAGRLLDVDDLRPGDRAERLLTIVNQTARTVELHIAAHGDNRQLDGRLIVEVAGVDAERPPRVSERIGALREPMPSDIFLQPGESSPLAVRLRLAPSGPDYRGAEVTIVLAVTTVPVDG